MSLLEKASIITTPTAYGVGVLNSIKPAYALGSELIPNGTFKENVNGWTTNNANASFVWQTDQTALLTSASFAYARLNPTLTLINAKYQVSFDVLSFEGTLANVHIGLGTAGNTVSAIGSYSYEYASTGGATEFQIRPNSGGTGSIKIDNISVKLITDADFDFTRTSSATRVNSDNLIETVSINSDELVQNGNFSELGSELVTNGNFETDSDWIKQSSWTISDGSANYDFSTNSNYLRQTLLNGGFVSGETYKINFEITEGTAYMNIKSNAETLESTALYSIGSYSIYVTASANGSDLLIYGLNTQGTAFSIDNVSVKQVDPNDNWTLVSTKYIDTNSFENTANNGRVFQSLTTVVGSKYKLSFIRNSGTLNVVASTTNNTAGTIQSTGNTTVSGAFEFTATSTTTFLVIYNIGASGSVASMTNVSLIEIQENGVPRLDYTNGIASILLDPQSTNLINYSQAISNSPVKNGTFVDNAAISPDGTLNATKLTATNTDPFFYQSIVYNAATYTSSIYVKGIGDSIGKEFRIAISSATTAPKLIVPSEWTRFEFTATISSGTSSAGIEITDPAIVGDEVLVWGWQLEEQAYATSYIPTSGSTVTRAAETLNNAGNSDLINSTEGVLYADISALSEVFNSRRFITLNDGGSSNTIVLRYEATGIITARYQIGGVAQCSISFATTIRNTHKVAFKYKQNNFALWVDGTEVGTDTTGNILNADTINKISFDSGNGSFPFYGRCKTVAVFKEALSDTELACLTTQ